MGAQQSTGQGNDANADNGSTKTCYYELLGVARDATDDDIKKAYRKRALELHPDRNYGDVDNATRRFAEVQSAYEVLSDPQERAWYDSHREAILRGVDGDDLDGHPPEFNNIRLTTTEEILSLIRGFNASIPFTNEPTGFYGILNETFSHLADEEVAAGAFEGHEYPRYPAFGESDDEFDSAVKPFYVSWAGFATAKSFAWKDKYRLSDAPDRRVRRMMEKDNKKLREDAAREFNDAVRFLVSFVRKRDPRYQANSQTADERREALRSAAAAQAARSRAANRERLDEENSVPEWARTRDDDLDAGKDHFPESEPDHDVEHIECVVCDKIFKSEKSYQAHEKSKKHIKAVQQLKRQMRNEGLELDLGDQVVDNARGTQAGDASPDEASTRDESPTSQSATIPTTTEEGNRDSKLRLSEDSQDDGDDEYAPRGTIEQRLGSAGVDASRTSGSVEQEEVDASDMAHELSKTSLSQYQLDVEPSDDKPPQKVGKAKAKREKKAARNNAATLEEHTCGVCRETFSSRSKLFSHIRDLDHAALKTVSSAKDKKHKKR